MGRQEEWAKRQLKAGLCAICGARKLAKRSKRRCKICLEIDRQRAEKRLAARFQEQR